MSNTTRTFGLKRSGRTLEERLELFDRLPRYLKEALWTIPSQITVNESYHKSEDFFEALLELEAIKMTKIPQTTLQFYGPDHPQANCPFEPLRL